MDKDDTLREFIKSSLNEYGDEFGDVSLGGWDDVVRVAGDPKHVMKTVLGNVAKISSKAKTVLSTIINGVPSLILPFVSTNYDRIVRDEDRRWSAIMQKYPDVFGAAKKAFPADASLVAFMVNPVLMTSIAASKTSAKTVADLVSALSAHDPVIKKKISLFGLHNVGEALTLEAPAGQGNIARQLVNDPAVQAKLKSSKVVNDIRQAARSIKNQTLNSVINLAQRVKGTQTMEDVRNLIGREPNLSAARSIQSDERENVEQGVLLAIQDGILDSLIVRLQTEIEELEDMNVPETADIVSAYQKTINRIEGMLSR